MDAFEPGARWAGVETVRFLEMSEGDLRVWAEGSPVKRAGYEGLARNAALVLGNRGEVKHLPVLDDARRNHPSELVREAADWGSAELRRRLASSE